MKQRKKRPEKKPKAKRRRAPSERREKSKRPDYIRRELHQPEYPLGFYAWRERFKDALPGFVPTEVLHDLWLVQEQGSAKNLHLKLSNVNDQKVIRFLFNYASRHTFESQKHREDLLKNMAEKMNKKAMEKILTEVKGDFAGSSIHLTMLEILSESLARVGDRRSLKVLAAHLAQHYGKFFQVGNVIKPCLDNIDLLVNRVTKEDRRMSILSNAIREAGHFNRSLVLAGFASDPRKMNELPTGLKDKRQRSKIEYLYNLKNNLKDRQPAEVARIMGLMPKKKKKK